MQAFFEALRDRDLTRALELVEPFRRELPVACLMGDLDAVRDALGPTPEPEPLDRERPPWQAAALTYVCHSPFLSQGVERAQGLHETARWLLSKGADPDAAMPSVEVSSGRSTSLMGAAAQVDRELTRLLLEHGADASDRSSLWDSTAVGILSDSPDARARDCLRLILARRPHPALLSYGLSRTLRREDPDATRLLLGAVADPEGPGAWGGLGSHLHVAIARGRSLEVIGLLLDSGADGDARDRDGRGALAAARRHAREDVARELEARGFCQVNGEGLEDARDDATGAAMRADRKALARIVSGHPDLRFRLRTSDHQLLVRAAERGALDAIRVLLELGCRPEVGDDSGRTALHVVTDAANLEALDVLLDAGAPPEQRDFDANTALDLAVRRAARPGPDRGRRRALVERLLARGARAEELTALPSGDRELDAVLVRRGALVRPELQRRFEEALDAVVDGNLGALREHLDREPLLVHARSRRPHRATLLHYVAANGVEDERQRTPAAAPAVARLLLERGADPDALAACYGGGTAQTTLCLMVSSAHPTEAGVAGELVHALAAGGVRLDGLDDDGAPLATALAFGSRAAFDALVQAGARVDNVVFAAAAGRLDLVQRAVDLEGRLRPGAEHCRVPWLGMPPDPRGGGQSALVRAAQFGREDVVRWLLEHGVDPDARPAFGRTALHEACVQGRAEVVAVLLEHGADPALRDAQRQASAFEWAAHGGQAEVLAILHQAFEP